MFAKNKKKAGKLRVSPALALGLVYLIIQLFLSAKGLVTQEIEQSLVFPAIIAIVVLSICVIALLFIAFRSRQTEETQEEEKPEQQSESVQQQI